MKARFEQDTHDVTSVSEEKQHHVIGFIQSISSGIDREFKGRIYLDEASHRRFINS